MFSNFSNPVIRYKGRLASNQLNYNHSFNNLHTFTALYVAYQISFARVLLLISDYVHLIRELIKRAKDSGVSDEAIDNLMNQQTIYHGQHLNPCKCKEIVEGRFDVSEIFRMEKQTNQDTIADKTFDFSSGTIQHLLNVGYQDTLRFIEEIIKSKIR